MSTFRVRLTFCALVPLSLYAQNAMWIATSSSDLETASNWYLSSVPTGIATFDSTITSINLYPQVLASGPGSLALSNFTFPHAANFMFTINGPYALNFSGAGCGITGTNTNTIITATNTAVGMALSQLTFSGTDVSLGEANLFAIVQTGGTLVNAPSTNDLAQILFDGSGDSSGKNCTITIDSSTAAMYVNNYGTITTSTTAINNLGQVVFDGSGGKGSGSAETGSSEVTILGNALLTVDTGNNQIVANEFQANNTGQILFDGSGGFSSTAGGTGQSIVTIGEQAQILTTLTGGEIHSAGIGNDVAQIAFDGSGGTSFGAGGKGSSTVVIKDNALISATAPNFGYIGYYSTGTANDTAQILFDGSGGTSYGAAGQGSSSVTITDSASLFASNTYYLAGEEDYGNDFAQILFDGSGGVGYHTGGSGSLTATINGAATITAENAVDYGFMYTDSAYVNDLAQVLFDGTPGLNYAGLGSGFCSVTIGENVQMTATNNQTITNYDVYANDVGQIVFDGSGGFGNAQATSNSVVVVIQDNAILTANLVTLNTLSPAYLVGGYGNNCGQIVFDGSGGFAYNHAGAGSAQVTLQGAAQLIASNSGILVSNNRSSSITSNNLAQILFDGSGGASTGAAGSQGSCTLSIADTVTLQATNSGTISNTATAFGGAINNIAQIVMDGGGGLNADGGGSGHLIATISTETPLSAINESGGTISNQTGSSANKIGQMIFDGSKGGPGSIGSGTLAITFENAASLSASNSGSISNTGTTLGLGQILFDGTGGSCTVQLGSTSAIFALNTATGTVGGDQIAFYDTVIQGNGTVKAVNEGGSILHGVAFYGPLITAENLNVELSGSSLWVDATTNSSFTIGSLSGDTSSTAALHQSLTINTSSGVQKTFAGNISGSGGVTITGNGQQTFSGVNSYTGATNILSGMLTLQNSNIPGTLFVASGATFSGTGTIAGAASIDGTIRPGNSPGTLTFLSGLTLSPGSTTQIEIDNSQASLLAVSGGNASIAGTLQILEDPGVRAGKTYPIVTVSGANLLGTFNKITTTGPLIPIVVYSSNEVTLTLENSPATFAALLSAPDRILRNTETLKHLDVRRQNVFKAQERSSRLTAQNSEIARFGRRPTQTQIQESHQLAERAERNAPKPWSIYIEPMGSVGHVTSKKNVFGNTFQMIGARAGTDYLWTEECMSDASWRYGVGFLAEYSHWWGQLYHNAGTFSNNSAYGSLYGTFVPKAAQELSFNLIGGGGYSWYTFHRYPLGSSSLQTKGNPGGVQADGLFDIEYVFRQTQFASLPKHLLITPTAAVQYTYAHINGYQESGAGIYNLKVDHQTSMTLSSLLGLRMGYLFLADSSITVYPEILAEWQHQFLNASIDTQGTSTATDFGEFPLTIPEFPRNSLIAGADVRIDIYKKAMIQLNYDLWYNQRGIINFFLLECKTEF